MRLGVVLLEDCWTTFRRDLYRTDNVVYQYHPIGCVKREMIRFAKMTTYLKKGHVLNDCHGRNAQTRKHFDALAGIGSSKTRGCRNRDSATQLQLLQHT